MANDIVLAHGRQLEAALSFANSSADSVRSDTDPDEAAIHAGALQFAESFALRKEPVDTPATDNSESAPPIPAILETGLACQLALYLGRYPWEAVTAEDFLAHSSPAVSEHASHRTCVQAAVVLHHLIAGVRNCKDDAAASDLLQQVLEGGYLRTAAVMAEALTALLKQQEQLPNHTAFSACAATAVSLAGSVGSLVVLLTKLPDSEPCKLLPTFRAATIQHSLELHLARLLQQLSADRTQFHDAAASICPLLKMTLAPLPEAQAAQHPDYEAHRQTLLASPDMQRFAIDALASLNGSPANDVKRVYVNILGLANQEGYIKPPTLQYLISKDTGLRPLAHFARGAPNCYGYTAVHASTVVGEASRQLGSQLAELPPKQLRQCHGVLLSALRQAAVMRQLHALPADRRGRAVRKASAAGMLKGTVSLKPSDGDSNEEMTSELKGIAQNVFLTLVHFQGAVPDVSRQTGGLPPLRDWATAFEAYWRTGTPFGVEEAMIFQLPAALLIPYHEQLHPHSGYWSYPEAVGFLTSLRKTLQVCKEHPEKSFPDQILSTFAHLMLTRGSDEGVSCAGGRMLLMEVLPHLIKVALSDLEPQSNTPSVQQRIWDLACLGFNKEYPAGDVLAACHAERLLDSLLNDRPHMRQRMSKRHKPFTLGTSKAWDYQLLTQLDPLTRILDQAEQVPLDAQHGFIGFVGLSLLNVCAPDSTLQLPSGEATYEEVEAAITRDDSMAASVLNDDRMKKMRTMVERVMAEVRALPPVAVPDLEALRLPLPIPGCWNPGCENTSGPAEILMEVHACSGCRAAKYCSVACQKAHRRAHKAACLAAKP